jgi:hypothetical protein
MDREILDFTFQDIYPTPLQALQIHLSRAVLSRILDFDTLRLESENGKAQELPCSLMLRSFRGGVELPQVLVVAGRAWWGLQTPEIRYLTTGSVLGCKFESRSLTWFRLGRIPSH